MHYITKKYSKNTLYNKEKQRKTLYNKDNSSKKTYYITKSISQIW